MRLEDDFVKYDTPYGVVHLDATAPVAAIKTSGGWDSATLTYALAHAIDEFDLDITIQPMTVNRRNLLTDDPVFGPILDRVNNHDMARGVVNFVKQCFPEVKFNPSLELHADYWWADWMNNKDNSYLYQQRACESYALWQAKMHKYNISLYSGTTLNPPIGAIESGPETRRDDPIEPNGFDDVDAAGIINIETFRTDDRKDTIQVIDIEPFRNRDKRLTMWLADNLGIMDDLIAISKSCEGRSAPTDNFTKECMTCWWCVERHWAMENYDKTT
jgi:hypothetical protein